MSVAAPVAVPASLQTFLAIDLGLKRTGIAVGNRLLRSATPQSGIRAEGKARLDKIGERIREWQPDALVIGVPVHPDGAPHDMTREAQRLGMKDTNFVNAAPPRRSRRVQKTPTPPRRPSFLNSS